MRVLNALQNLHSLCGPHASRELSVDGVLDWRPVDLDRRSSFSQAYWSSESFDRALCSFETATHSETHTQVLSHNQDAQCLVTRLHCV